MLTFCLFIISIAAYLLGATNGAIITSKYFFKKDIRNFGSGNAGLTNFYRVFGKRGTVVVILIDALKAILAICIGGLLMKPFHCAVVGKLVASFFAMLGHAFPVYYGFKGGKTVLCGGICAIFLDWRVGLLCWLVFIIVVIATRYVSLGSICAGIMLPTGVAIFGGWWLEVVLALMCGGLLVGMHWQNILRLAVGKERKFAFHSSEEEKSLGEKHSMRRSSPAARPAQAERRERAEEESARSEREAREEKMADSIRRRITGINWYESTEDDDE